MVLKYLNRQTFSKYDRNSELTIWEHRKLQFDKATGENSKTLKPRFAKSWGFVKILRAPKVEAVLFRQANMVMAEDLS